jgi:hypothetical protein
MSILTGTLNRPTITKDQILANKASRIKLFSKESYQKIIDIQKQGIDSVWSNRGDITPQEICDSLGSDVVKIFQIHGILTNAIIQIAAIDGISPDIALPTNAFEVVDGKIVVSDDPYTA